MAEILRNPRILGQRRGGGGGGGASKGKGRGTSQILAGGLLPMIARFPLNLEFLTPLLWKVRLSGPGVKLSLDSLSGSVVTGRTLTLPSPAQ